MPHRVSHVALTGAEKVQEVTAVAAPTLGPAIITVFGADIPVLALGLSVAGLVLARMIAPPPVRKLTKKQDVALTALLVILLFVIVTGAFTGEPLGVGMAVVWAIGLGFSGILVIEFFGSRSMAALRALFGHDERGQVNNGDNDAPPQS